MYSQVSDDMATWTFLTVSLEGLGPQFGPRFECPYTISIGNTTILKVSSPGRGGFGRDFLFPGHASRPNGSGFVPDLSSDLNSAGVQMDYGGEWPQDSVYAGGILYEPQEVGGRSIYLGAAAAGWVNSLQSVPPADQVRKRIFLRHFMLKRSFYQDKLGTNIGKAALKKEWRFLTVQRCDDVAPSNCA